MNQEFTTDSRLRQYLLGTLPEGERTQVETEYFADDPAFEQLLAAEDELIDAYAGGELTAAERERFDHAFLTTPRRRNRVAFARALRTAVTRTATQRSPATPARMSWWDAIAGWLPAPPVVRHWAAAAAAVVVVASVSWLALERAQLQDAVGRVEAERGDLVRQTEALRSQLDDERRRAAAPVATVPAAPETPAGAPGERASVIATMILSPGLVRGGSDSNTLRMAPGVALVRLQLELESNSHPRYRPVLATASGEEVWSQRAIAAATTGDATSVTFELPASLLTNRDYILTLSGVGDDDQAEEVAAYSFRVLPP